MANALYVKGAEKILGGTIDLDSDTIKVALVKNTYAQNLTTDEFHSTIATYIVGTPQSLSGKSVSGGKFDADDPTFTAVSAGDTIEALVIYKDTGVSATSPLIAYLDAVTGIPFATNGGDITPRFDAGAYRIFSLV